MSKNIEILNKLSEGNKSNWLEQARKRERFGWWYDIKFYVVLQWVLLKRKFKEK